MRYKDFRHLKHVKRIIATLSLVAALVFSVAFLQNYFCIPATADNNRVISFHNEQTNTLDVVLIGSSTLYSGFASGYAYDLYGYTSYPYALGGSTCTMWKPALVDVLRTQNPKLIVVDVFGGAYIPSLVKSRTSQIYTVMSHMDLSLSKIKLARYLSEITDDHSKLNFLFPFLRYHENILSNFKHHRGTVEIAARGASPLKGIETITRISKPKPLDESLLNETLPLDTDIENIIRDFMNFCKKQNVQVLFVKYPAVLSSENEVERAVSQRSNTILMIAKEYGFSTINLQDHYNDMQLDQYRDFYNHGHTNTRGQKKITKFLGKYIQRKMKISPSTLSEPNRQHWDYCAKCFYAFDRMSEDLIKEGQTTTLTDTPNLVVAIKKQLQCSEGAY